MSFAHIPRTVTRNRHDHIDAALAAELYNRWGSWNDVSKILIRPDGTRYTPVGIRQAVRAALTRERQRRRERQAYAQAVRACREAVDLYLLEKKWMKSPSAAERVPTREQARKEV